MAKNSSAPHGMALITLANLLFTGTVVANKLLADWKWPYFRMIAIINAIGLCVSVAMIVYTRASVPEKGVRKWIVLRGVFGAVAILALMLAARLGAPPGDIAALTSVNIVVAALVAFMFLKEPLRRIHGFSVICAFVGVVLIAKPEFIFGGSSDGAPSMLGYIFAIVAGFFMAGIFITSRIAGEASFWYHTLSTNIFNVLLCASLPYTPFIEDYTMRPLVDSPGLAAMLLSALFLFFFMSLILASAGAQLCPTAVSATLNTASLMTFGYLGQLVVFDEKPDALGLVGAALMLVAVFMIALLQVSQPKRINSSTEQTAAQLPVESDARETIPHSDGNAPDSFVAVAEDDNESIASFVASEFVSFGTSEASTEVSPQLRHRANRADAISNQKKQAHVGIGTHIFADAQIVGRFAFQS